MLCSRLCKLLACLRITREYVATLPNGLHDTDTRADCKRASTEPMFMIPSKLESINYTFGDGWERLQGQCLEYLQSKWLAAGR